MRKRVLDLVLLGFFFPILLSFFLFIAVLVRLSSGSPVLYWSKRVGRFNKEFSMPKFRTMIVETPSVASHLLDYPSQYLTPLGFFLRKTSLDELPQCWSILIGEMSFVGPRPALFNQHDLINLRTKKGIHNLHPGLTGWAQINGRDNVSLQQKVAFDEEYMNYKSLSIDLKILVLTIFRVISSNDISH